MSERPRTLTTLPIACELSASGGREQLERWRAFDDDYALSSEETEGSYVVHYAKLPDSEARLAELVAQESRCCSFADWSIDASSRELRLVVTGTPEALAALSIR